MLMTRPAMSSSNEARSNITARPSRQAVEWASARKQADNWLLVNGQDSHSPVVRQYTPWPKDGVASLWKTKTGGPGEDRPATHLAADAPFQTLRRRTHHRR